MCTHGVFGLDGGLEIELGDEQPLGRVLNQRGRLAEMVHHIEHAVAVMLLLRLRQGRQSAAFMQRFGAPH